MYRLTRSPCTRTSPASRVPSQMFPSLASAIETMNEELGIALVVATDAKRPLR